MVLEAKRVSRQEAEARHQRRFLRLRWQRNGMLRVSGLLPDVDGKAFEVVIGRGAAEQPRDPETGVMRPLEERQADALSDLASVELAADAEPDLATVVVHCDASALVDESAEDTALASIQLGPLVAQSTVLRLCCDGRIQLVVDDEHGATIKVVRTEHAIPRWMRRTILHRDGRCRFPGCERTAFLHLHHLIFHSNGGLTEEANLAAVCTFHHRLLHEGGWTVEGNPHGELTWRSPRGILRTGPPPLRADVRQQLHLPEPAHPLAAAA